MTLDAFQKAYGSQLRELLTHPAFTAALVMLRTTRRNQILALSDEEIKERGSEHLAKYKGSIEFEFELQQLPSKREFKIVEEGPLEYLSPEEEARVEELISKLGTERETRKKKGM